MGAKKEKKIRLAELSEKRSIRAETYQVNTCGEKTPLPKGFFYSKVKKRSA
jgi:hypothetical protein